jgi:hypothetical protein
MRLGLFDRIRRLVHPRGFSADPAAAGGHPSPAAGGHASSAVADGTARRSTANSGTQGRHRRGHDGGSWHPPDRPAVPWSSASSDGGPPELTHTASLAPDVRARQEPQFPPRTWPTPAPADVRPHRGDHPRTGRPYVSGSPAMRAGAARVRIREAPADAAAPAAVPDPQAMALERTAADVPPEPHADERPSRRHAAALRARLPFARPHPKEQPPTADGRRNCGSLEDVLWRQWDETAAPPVDVVVAIDRLAELPDPLKERLARGLDGIFVGPGGVPELDEMTALRGVPLPSGQASWDACAGAYGERKIVVGSQPSPTPDVMCHEVGHALDDLDSPPGKWQSDSAEFRMLYDQCQPHLASDFHRQPGGLGRKEFFADAFAAIASRQRPALVDMLGGETRTALRVMLFFNRRYGI